MTKTVIQHVLSRLHDIGVNHVFGVPGDYAFAINDAICNDLRVRWVGCCNELNAAYAADGYARIQGVGAVCTTYGVGELSTINGIAGAYAEHLPVFHLVGMPNLSIQAARRLMHHTLGNGEYDLFGRWPSPWIAHAVMTPQNVASETERLIAEALYHRRPVYMAFPADLANQLVLGGARLESRHQRPHEPPGGEVGDRQAWTRPTRPAFCRHARRPDRAASRLQAVIDASGLPFATMFMDKSVLEEHQPAYIGMYDGRLMNQAVRGFVEIL